MLSTANYVARKYGVRSAMPGFIAKVLCPDLIILPHNSEKYREASGHFKEVLKKYDPDFESMGSDEGNLDLTNYLIDNELSGKEDVWNLCNDIR